MWLLRKDKRRGGRHAKTQDGLRDQVDANAEDLAALKAWAAHQEEVSVDVLAAVHVLVKAGIPVPDAAARPVPPELVLAAETGCPQTVHLDVDGHDVIVGTTGKGGDPAAMWRGILKLTSARIAS